MILNCSNVTKSYDGVDILRDVSFHVEEHEKAAVVGINGAGKSTLLKIIMGEIPAESGTITFAKEASVGYLAQHQDVSSNRSIYEELLSVKQDIIDLEHELRKTEKAMATASDGELETLMSRYASMDHQFEQRSGYAYKSELIGVLKGLGFGEEDFDRDIATLSGGQKTRVALGKLLLTKPDLIILDEPTNHLDMESVHWLETYLMNYAGAVLIVTHDRYFLDHVVEKIIEIDQTKATVFRGNYSDYAAKKEVLRRSQMNEYLKQQADIKHQEAVIEKLKQFNREKSIKRAESREKMLDRMERVEKPTEANAAMHLQLEPGIVSGNDVLYVEDLAKGYDGNFLFDGIGMDLKRGERVAIIGNNGTGKTTILKLIHGILPPDRGVIRLGTNVSIGYYDQEQQVLHMDKTIFEEIQDTYPDMNNTRVRNVLAAFLFTGEDVFKYIKELSGGERGRVSLAKLMLSNANFLILDEPTNHLDIVSKEILENALNSYTGTVLYVSHDRYFINRTATRILELKGNVLTNYVGNYDYYLEKKEILGVEEPTSAANTSKSSKTSAQAYKSAKEAQNAKKRLENEIRKVEEKIASLEERQSECNAKLSNPAMGNDVAGLMQVHKDLEAVEKELESLYERWEELSSQVEN
ncbi:MAG: ABC-F family ATP-binding cassette domain-containing protein [Lachnospiraceae bacterium]|nr:ABC-F family ATP-binding cassette domain-containing protein [Lachnospiraceae bacterium]